MAEYILKDMTEAIGSEENFAIVSAAVSSEEIWNGTGNPVYPPARKKLEEHGISCGGKRARLLTAEDYDRYDLLLGMDDGNLAAMRRICGGDPEGKMKKLLFFAGEDRSVADPWYTGDFDSTWTDLVRGCLGLLEHLGADTTPLRGRYDSVS